MISDSSANDGIGASGRDIAWCCDGGEVCVVEVEGIEPGAADTVVDEGVVGFCAEGEGVGVVGFRGVGGDPCAEFGRGDGGGVVVWGCWGREEEGETSGGGGVVVGWVGAVGNLFEFEVGLR